MRGFSFVCRVKLVQKLFLQFTQKIYFINHPHFNIHAHKDILPILIFYFLSFGISTVLRSVNLKIRCVIKSKRSLSYFVLLSCVKNIFKVSLKHITSKVNLERPLAKEIVAIHQRK